MQSSPASPPRKRRRNAGSAMLYIICETTPSGQAIGYVKQGRVESLETMTFTPCPTEARRFTSAAATFVAKALNHWKRERRFAPVYLGKGGANLESLPQGTMAEVYSKATALSTVAKRGALCASAYRDMKLATAFRASPTLSPAQQYRNQGNFFQALAVYLDNGGRASAELRDWVATMSSHHLPLAKAA